jgi:diguanylate cyclase (GGDEF)-like protein/PAS domain S-box-containing protein
MSQLESRRQVHQLAAELASHRVAAERFARNQQLLDGLLRHTNVLFYAKDLTGRYLLSNDAHATLTGLEPGTVVGRTDFDLFTPALADQLRANDALVAATGEQMTFHEAADSPDGHTRAYLTTKFPLVSADGRTYAVAGVSADVTELAAARQTLAESEQRWRALVEHSPVAVAVYGLDDLRFRYVNPQAARLYGVADTDALVGRSYLDVIPEAVVPSYLDNVALLRDGESLRGKVSRIRRLDGIEREVEINAVAVSYDGQPAVQVELRDVSHRVAAEVALRASEARFRAMFTGAPFGVAEFEPDGTFISANPRFCDLLGYDLDELVGLHVSVVTDPADRDQQARQIAALAHEADGYTTERVFRHKDGRAVPVLVSVRVVSFGDGSPDRPIGMAVDISQQLAAEEALRDAMAALERKTAFDEAVLETVQAGVLACDADGTVVIRNAAQRRMTGGTGDLIPDDPRLLVLRDDATDPTAEDAHLAPLQLALEGGELVDLPVRVGPPEGPLHDVLLSVRRILDARGALIGAVAAYADVSKERRTQAELRASAAFHDAMLAASPDLIFVIDPVTGTHVYASRTLVELLGYTEEQLTRLGEAVVDVLVHPEDVDRLRAANAAARDLDDGEVLQIRYRTLCADGVYRWLSRRVTPFARDEQGTVVQILGVARDITDIVEVEDRLQEAALRDPLTGLANRTLLADRLRQALARGHRTGQDLAVLFLDLDGFKHVNDTGGHAAGDKVLQVTAQRLQAALRPEDSVARVGGDEFVVLVEPALRVETEPAGDPVDLHTDALGVAARIKTALEEPVVHAGTQYVVTASIGVTFANATSNPDEVLRDADIAMYRAKSTGKDRHQVFDETLRTAALERGRVERTLREAVHAFRREAASPRRGSAERRGRAALEVAYQPIFSLDTRELSSVEALARLIDAHGEHIRPEVFIPVAEETGLIAPLGRHVLDRACDDLAGWHAAHPDHAGLGLAVNLSARQAGLVDLVAQVEHALARNGLAPQRLTLELTESVLLEAGRSTMSAMNALHDLGVAISIDDFGTGFASLRYLAQLPVRCVKVDRSFTAGLPADATSATIVKAITGLARDLGLACVVEGIETQAQLDALPAGVQGQGFLLGAPVSVAGIDALLAACGAD